MAIHNLTLPIDDVQVEKLEIGDIVYLTGLIYTARDMAHLQIKNLLATGAPLPVDLCGKVIFHAGPVVKRENKKWKMVVIGPTTSIRMEPYANMVANLGVKLIIGKGGMAGESLAMFQQHKQAYLQAAPGCAVQIAAGVEEVIGCTWLENGMPEAMWELKVKEIGPFIVTMDCHGNSRYGEVKRMAISKIEHIYG